jgi:signal transduction histidine kinase
MFRKLPIECFGLVHRETNRNDCQEARFEIKGSNFTLHCFLFLGFGGLILLLGAGVPDSTHASDFAALQSSQILTNVSQFRALTSQDYLRGCSFHLIGTVTLVDTNRNLLVLQDKTGAVALNMDMKTVSVQPEELVCVDGTGASPYVASFPDYPNRPSGWDIQPSFEAPSNWGDYHLTRMRGYLHPPITAEYTFWIASDNSSELWLSPDEDPGKVRRIAFVRQGDWVNSREWSRYPSQRSEPILLQGHQAYYIEAFQEQITLYDNLAVAWQFAGFEQSVIYRPYLSPYIASREQAWLTGTNGILREYWTNFTAGNLTGLTGPRPLESALTAKEIHVEVLGSRYWPEPRRKTPNQQLLPEENYSWVEVEGTVDFVGIDGATAELELTNGQERVQVRVSNPARSWSNRLLNQPVQVQGVGEGVRDANGQFGLGFVWVPTRDNLTILDTAETNRPPLAAKSPYHFSAPSGFTNRAWGSFLSVRGVVTFSGKALGKDCLFIQDGAAGINVSQAGRQFGNRFQVGQWVELGGEVQSGKYTPSLNPIIATVLGWRPMPEPVTEPVSDPVAVNRDGQWTQLEGVVRSLNPNGTLTLMGAKGPVAIWIDRIPVNALAAYVDCTLRIRGVLSLTLMDSPVVLVPSPSFVEVEEEAADDPFEIPLRSIASLKAAGTADRWLHRTRIAGVVTYVEERLLFVQDASGGERVETGENPRTHVGDSVQVVGFPEAGGSSPALTEALIHGNGAATPLLPQKASSEEAVLDRLNGTLVQLEATLLGQETGGTRQILELREGQRVFEAVFAPSNGKVPAFLPGSLLKITGVCEVETVPSLATASTSDENFPRTSVRVYLRSPQDIYLLRKPSWWTTREAAAVMGVMLAVLLSALLAVYIYRRRLHRQKAAQLAFSRQILQGQESERHRIASNLHDSLGQSLLIIKNQAWLARQPITDESVRRRLDEISEVTSQAIEEVRQITHDLRPYQLDKLGLTQSIRAIIKRVSETSSIRFESDVDGIDGLFDQESEIHVYRIVQECLNNVVKHSNATQATLAVKRQPAGVSISIQDNGRGFETGLINSTGLHDTGFGLSGIGARARILGGKLTVDSRLGQGAHLLVLIPQTKTETCNPK